MTTRTGCVYQQKAASVEKMTTKICCLCQKFVCWEENKFITHLENEGKAKKKKIFSKGGTWKHIKHLKAFRNTCHINAKPNKVRTKKVENLWEYWNADERLLKASNEDNPGRFGGRLRRGRAGTVLDEISLQTKNVCFSVAFFICSSLSLKLWTFFPPAPTFALAMSTLSSSVHRIN